MSTGTQDAFLDELEIPWNTELACQREEGAGCHLISGEGENTKVEKVLPSQSGDCLRKGVIPSVFFARGKQGTE